MANVIRMGSLYLDGRPILPWVEFHGDETIGIRKAVPGKEIPWVLVNGILIADRCLLSNISWDDLNAQRLIFGKEVSVGGLRYTLRSLRVGASEDMPNEWDAALDIVGENGGVWTGKGPRFWGQERAAGIPLYRVLRGGEPARLREAFDASFRYIAFGFRPVLEPLSTVRLDKLSVGQRVAIWGSQEVVRGWLEEVTDYEVVLSGWSEKLHHAPGFGCEIGNGRIAVDRGAILSIQEC